MEKILWDYANVPLHPFTHWFYHHWAVPVIIITAVFVKWQFCVSGIALHLLNRNSSFTICPFYLPVYLCLYRLIWTKGYLILLVICNTIISFQLWPLETLSAWILHPFEIFHPFLSTSLFSGTKDVPGASSIPCTPVLKSTHSLKSPGSFYWKIVCRVQELGTRYAHCYQIVTASSRTSQRTDWKYIYLLIHAYIHMYISIIICRYNI